MDFAATARTLWQAWLDQEAALASDTPDLPFFLMLDEILEQRQATATVDALYDLQPPVADEETLHRLVEVIQRWAEQQDVIGDREDQALRAVLIGVPMGGPAKDLVLDASFWSLLESHLHAVLTPYARRQMGEALTLGLLPVDTALHPEACAQLTLDDLRQVTDELLEETAGPRLTQMFEQHARFVAAEDAQAPMVQRIGLAVLVVDPGQFPGDLDVLDILAQADVTAPDWTGQFNHGHRWVFPPQDLASAMTQALWYHLRSGVDLALMRRRLPLDPTTVSWASVDEDAHGVLSFVADTNGVLLDPVVVSGAWVTLVGPLNTARTLGMWDEAIEPTDDEEADEAASVVAPSRRLH